MKKRMLEKYTSRYDKVPSWLMIMLSCFIAFGYFLISGFLSGIVVGIPMAIVLSFLVLNGNIQFQDINTISYKMFSNMYFQLGTFAFTALAIFFWVKVVEKRPIRTLGFFKGHIWLNLLKGWGLGTLLLLVSWRVRISKSRLFSENPLIYTIPNPFLVYPRWNRGTGDTWLVTSDGD